VGELGGRCVADGVVALSQDTRAIAEPQVESIVQPDGIADDIWRNR
jgi:hypothetical protein